MLGSFENGISIKRVDFTDVFRIIKRGSLAQVVEHRIFNSARKKTFPRNRDKSPQTVVPSSLADKGKNAKFRTFHAVSGPKLDQAGPHFGPKIPRGRVLPGPVFYFLFIQVIRIIKLNFTNNYRDYGRDKSLGLQAN
jgi:hypothetical protein